MIRKFSLLVFAVALIVSACGRQVTPDRPGTGPGGTGLPSGFMQIKFRVQQPFNFSNYQYVIIFNTEGTPITPLPNTFQTNYAGFDFAMIVSQVGGVVGVQFKEYVHQPNTTPYVLPITYAPQQILPINLNSNGAGTEFTVTFDRRVLYNSGVPPAPISTASSSPTTSASASPTPTPTASPSASPSTSPSTSPTVSALPAPYPTSAAQEFWLFNALTTDQNGVPTDSLGVGGKNDTTYQSQQLDTSQPFDLTQTATIGALAPDPSAQITSIEVLNNP